MKLIKLNTFFIFFNFMLSSSFIDLVFNLIYSEFVKLIQNLLFNYLPHKFFKKVSLIGWILLLILFKYKILLNTTITFARFLIFILFVYFFFYLFFCKMRILVVNYLTITSAHNKTNYFKTKFINRIISILFSVRINKIKKTKIYI